MCYGYWYDRLIPFFLLLFISTSQFYQEVESLNLKEPWSWKNNWVLISCPRKWVLNFAHLLKLLNLHYFRHIFSLKLLIRQHLVDIDAFSNMFYAVTPTKISLNSWFFFHLPTVKVPSVCVCVCFINPFDWFLGCRLYKGIHLSNSWWRGMHMLRC